ncbi:storkhead-box protein 1-like [Chlamydotis macqueenii]
MPRRAERCLQIAPHSLAIVLGAAAGGGRRPEAGGGGGGGAGARPAAELGHHRIGYEIFADFKRENMQHFWDRRATAAVAETFFLGWIDEQVLLVQGKEEHLEVLRQGWARRSLKPPTGFRIECMGHCFSIGGGFAYLFWLRRHLDQRFSLSLLLAAAQVLRPFSLKNRKTFEIHTQVDNRINRKLQNLRHELRLPL